MRHLLVKNSKRGKLAQTQVRINLQEGFTVCFVGLEENPSL